MWCIDNSGRVIKCKKNFWQHFLLYRSLGISGMIHKKYQVNHKVEKTRKFDHKFQFFFAHAAINNQFWPQTVWLNVFWMIKYHTCTYQMHAYNFTCYCIVRKSPHLALASCWKFNQCANRSVHKFSHKWISEARAVVVKLFVSANTQVFCEKIEKVKIFNFRKEKYENLSLVCRGIFSWGSLATTGLERTKKP